MKNPAAGDIVKSIKAFLSEFGASEPNVDRDSTKVQVFFFLSEIQNMKYDVIQMYVGKMRKYDN